MFDAGFDQAEGLKRLFFPKIRSRLNVIGIDADRQAGDLAAAVGSDIARRGYDVQWDDPDGLLPKRLVRCHDNEAEQIVISASRTQQQDFEESKASCSIFACALTPTKLPELYSALKMAHEANSGAELSVLWLHDGGADSEMKKLCESNLARTVRRFLSRPVEFLNSNREDGRTTSSELMLSSLNNPQFLNRLSDLLLNRLGITGAPVSATRN